LRRAISPQLPRARVKHALAETEPHGPTSREPRDSLSAREDIHKEDAFVWVSLTQTRGWTYRPREASPLLNIRISEGFAKDFDAPG